MSDVLEAVRAKYPEYKGILDDELAVALGNKYPQYLDHADFKAEYDRGRGLGVIPGVGVEGETGFRPGPEMIPPPTPPPVEHIVLDQPVRIPRIGPQKGPASQLAAGIVNAAAGIVESTVNEPAFALAGAPGAVGKLARAAITPVVAAQLPGMAVESGKELLKGNVQGAVEQGALPLAAAYGLKRSLTPLTDAAAKTGPPVSGATLEMPRGARPPMEAAPELYLALPEQAAAQAKAMTREATAAYEAPKPPKPEVPGTPAEPYETVLEAIRNAKADTTSKVQALFPAAQLSRQAAAELRRQAFGQEKAVPPEAEPIMDKLAEAIDKGDFAQVKKLAKGLSESPEVPLDVFDLEKQPVDEAKRAAEAAKAETPPTSKAPDWAMEELKRQGWNTKWPFVQADLYNKDFRDLIRSDPGISAEEKAKILSFGPKEAPPAAPPAETVMTRTEKAVSYQKKKAAERPEDIIDYILGKVGKIKLKTSAKPGSEGYYTPEYDALRITGAGKQLFAKEGIAPDEAVDMLRREGVFSENATVDDLWEAALKATESRRSYHLGQTPEQKQAKFWAHQEKLSESGKQVLVNVGDLNIGDKFSMGGEQFEIIHIDPDTGEVTVKNGKKFGAQTVPDGHQLPVDPGSLEQKPAGEWEAPATQPPANAAFSLEKPESVEEQKARQAQEQQAALKKAEQEAIAAGQAKPLSGSVGDIGQQDMFGGGDLFSMGPGAQTAGEPPKAQIEQLTDAFKGIEGQKVPLGDQVKQAFDVGGRTATAKDAFGRALGGLKATGDYLVNLFKGATLDDLLREKGKLSSELEKRGWRTREWAKVAAKQIPSIAERKAISSYIDAGGDRGLLDAAAKEVPENRKQAYRDALNLSPEAQLAADNISNYFNARLQEAIDAGILEEGLEDYIHRIYRDRPDLEQRAVAYVQSGILQANPGLARQRMFQFDFEAEKAGLNVEKDFIPRIVDYEVSLSKAIAARSFIREASKITMEDGQPMLAQAATGTPIETEAGRQATLIKPSGKVTRESDYVERPYSALKKWTWAANDVEGKPILVQGNLMVHKDAVGRIDALLKPSQVRYGRYGKLGKAALAVSSTVKQTMLDLSFFHQVQLTVHGLEHRVLPWKILKDIDFENPNVEGLLRGGVTLGGEGYAGNYMEGLVGRSLTQHIPGLGKVVRSYQDWLFQNYIPRLKMTMAMDALERNRKRYPKMAEEELMYLTAREANAAFGEQNYIMLERSKSFQDVARLIMLAPDFLESRGRFAAQAFTRFGGEQRMALLLGAVAMWTTARLINKATDDQWHFEPDNLFSVVHDGKAYGLRTVQGDILHLMEKPLQFWMYRLNPLYARTAIEGLTGRDAFGRKRTIGQQAMDAISTLVPISLRSSREKGIWESIAQSMGVNARRYSDVDSAFTLAKKWKDTHGIKQRGEFIYDPEKDELRGLKIALSSGDDADAVGEVKKLLESKTITRSKLNAYFDRYASMPFTGSAAHDRQFVAGLSEDERKTVQSAKNHKKTIRQLYKQALHQYDAAKATEPR